MPDSFCEFWWEIEEQLMVHRVCRPGLTYLNLRNDQIDHVDTVLRKHCEQMGTPELYGPTDDELRSPQIAENFAGSWPNLGSLAPAGLRVPTIQYGCLFNAIKRGEVCPEWGGDPPRSPINTVRQLAAYLQREWGHKLQKFREPDSWYQYADMLDEIVPVIQNVRRTIAWFEQHGRLPHCVIIDCIPERIQDLQTYVRELDAWLQNVDETELLTDTPKRTEPSPKSGFLDLVVDTKHRTISRASSTSTSTPISILGSQRQWDMFMMLYKMEGTNLTDEQLRELRGITTQGNLRKHKEILNDMLARIRITIPDKCWFLTEK